MASPLVSTDMATLPIAYAVLPRKKREYTGGLTTTTRARHPPRAKCGSAACTAAYRPSALTRCISWKRFVGVRSTGAHHTAPAL
jgi:hypothetical protein